MKVKQQTQKIIIATTDREIEIIELEQTGLGQIIQELDQTL